MARYYHPARWPQAKWCGVDCILSNRIGACRRRRILTASNAPLQTGGIMELLDAAIAFALTLAALVNVVTVLRLAMPAARDL